MALHIRELSKWLAVAPQDAAGYISGAGMTGDFGEQWDGISPFVIPSVLWSIYAQQSGLAGMWIPQPPWPGQ
jgi:hypothetical protein